MRKVIATLLLLLCVGAACRAASRWESVSAPGRTTPLTERLAEGSESVEVTVADGYVYVTCAAPTTVKVFTILGQLVSQETLPAGTHRLRLTLKGIYILKVADQTRRITI